MPSRRELANAIRALSMDAVEKAKSGHPGMPMGMADIAQVLWNEFLSHNPNNPKWPNRDRFILSNGHGSMLQYSLLHLTGYALTIDDLKNFRQLHSKTPGHPEYAYTPGVETTTGPLGQGLANGVGMALAEQILASHFNQNGHNIIDHHTYVFAGDGCLMEGISHEVCSLAGTLGLGKLIVFYDDNEISIDGKVKNWFTDNTPERFRAYHWQVIENVDGHDSEAIVQAIKQAQAETDKPTIICCKTQIAWGAPNLAGSEKSHGAPLGDAEIKAAREQLNWPHAPFVIPEDVKASWDARETGAAREREWQKAFEAYQQDCPDLAAELKRRLQGALPASWQQTISEFIATLNQEGKDTATRKASQAVLNELGAKLPELLGGSADLTGSNLTMHKDSKTVSKADYDGNYIYYGVREFGMSAILNGLALYGGFIPYAGTFLVFTDYARNAVRLSAMMKQRVIHVYTHDSIGLGEDGPTHQPIEHAAMLRYTPNMTVWRPCDAVETAIAWKMAIQHDTGPSALLLSRQTLAFQKRSDDVLSNIERGGYILKDCDNPSAIIIATGSEIELAVNAYEQLTQAGKQVRVVSMPCAEIFDQQDKAYQEKVLPPGISKRVAVEAAQADYWYKYVGLEGKIIGLRQFGESAPYQAVYQALGITTEAVIQAVNEIL